MVGARCYRTRVDLVLGLPTAKMRSDARRGKTVEKAERVGTVNEAVGTGNKADGFILAVGVLDHFHKYLLRYIHLGMNTATLLSLLLFL